MTLSIRRADALLRGGQRDEARALLASLEATAPGFIVLTSLDRHGDMRRFASLGFAGYLTKPVRASELFECMDRVLARNAREWHMQSQPIGSAVNNSNSAAMLTGRLSDLLAKGNGIPIAGPMITEPLQGLTMQLQARSLRDLSRGLTPAVQRGGPTRAALPLSLLLAAPASNGRENDHRP